MKQVLPLQGSYLGGGIMKFGELVYFIKIKLLKNLKSISIVSMLVVLILSFQNCGKAFNSESGSQSSDSSENGIVKFSSESLSNSIVAESNYGYFKNLNGVQIRSGGSGSIDSNVQTLSGLPAEGALLSIQELQTPEQNAQGHFSFNINNEASWYGQTVKHRKVFNGDRLKLRALASYYFETSLKVGYSIGNVMASEWSVTTMSDPGSTAVFSNSNQSLREVSVGDKVLSQVLTVSGLGQNISVPLGISGAGGREEIIINGALNPPNTQARIKNGDRLQIRYLVTSADTIRMRIYSIPVGIRGDLQIRNTANWVIFPIGVVSAPKVAINCSGTITIKDTAFCQLTNLQAGDQIDWYVNGVIIDYLKNLARISTAEPQLGRHTFSARITHNNGEIEYTEEKIILVK